MSQAVTFTLAETHLKSLLPVSMLEQLAPYFQRAHAAIRNVNHAAAGKWPDKVRVIPATQTLLPPLIAGPVQEALYGALFKDRQLLLSYVKKGSSAPRQKVVNPLGLVQRGQITYLVCTYPSSAKPIPLAIHRIQSAEQLADPAAGPTGFSLDQAIEDGLLSFQRSQTAPFEAIFDRKAASHLHETPLSPDQIISDVDAGHIRVQATIADTEQLKWWLLGFGVKVEVLKPVALRTRIADIVGGLHQIYGIPNDA